VRALSSGQLDKGVVDLITEKLANAPTAPLSADDPQAFLTAVAANSLAAVNFAKLVDAEKLHALFNVPPFYQSDKYGGYNTKIDLLKVLTVAAGELHSPEEIKALLEKVAPGFTESPAQGVDELKAVLPDLTRFLATCGGQLMAPAPPLTGKLSIGNAGSIAAAADDKAIGRWAQTNGGNLNWLTPFAQWVGEADETAKKDQEKAAAGFVGFFLDVVVVALLDKFLPEPVGSAVTRFTMKGLTLTIGGIVNTGVHQAFEPTLAKMFSRNDIKRLDKALAQQVSADFPPGADPKEAMSDLLWLRSRVLTTIQVFNNYTVVNGKGKVVDLAGALGTDDVSTLAAKLRDRDNKWTANISHAGGA
jgi:hypothetical protein